MAVPSEFVRSTIPSSRFVSTQFAEIPIGKTALHMSNSESEAFESQCCCETPVS